jgi:hypothetical protein|tara:strand:- start:772 stop:1377 length:606 start_codon:yes stop_codon:yes gene_type:complete
MITDKEVQNLPWHVLLEFNEIKKEISKNPEWGFHLPEKEFIQCMSLITGQSYGTRIQNYIRNKLKWKKVLVEDELGDMMKPLFNELGKFVEVKSSLLTLTNDKLNWVQIRLFHDIDYYLGVAYELRDLSNYESFKFLLTHDQMVEECVGANAAHGTKSVNKSNENVELALRITCNEGNPEFERWKKMYRVDSYEGIEKGVL